MSIYREKLTGNLIITPEDIPAVAGMLLSSRDNLVEDRDKIPGSFLDAYEGFLDTAKRFEEALKLAT